MKRIIAILVLAAMLLSLTACGGSAEDPKQDDAVKSTEPVYVEEPVTITLWHNRGAGANLNVLRASIEAFNATNEYGITVEEEYMGGYSTVLSKTATAVAAHNNPALVLLHQTGIASLASKGCLADMTAYAARDGFDMGNYMEVLTQFSYYEGQLVSFPYVASTCMLVYNKDILAEAGYDAPPTTIAEMEEYGRTIKEKTGKFGFGMYISAEYIVDSLVDNLSGTGILGDDNSVDCLDNGSLKKVMDDWRRWIDEGWCEEPNVTNGSAMMAQDMQNGVIAMTAYSSGGMADMLAYATEAGQNIDFGYLPGYDGPSTNIGGGNLAVVGANHSQQEIAAAWEFIKFLNQDEWVVKNAMETGYLPTTHSSAKDPQMVAFWEENPWFKRAFDQLEWASAGAFSPFEEEWKNAVTNALSYVIQDGTMTSDEAIEYLKKQATVIFYE